MPPPAPAAPSAIGALFSADGFLAQALADYRPRQGQIEMAEQVMQALDGGGHYVLEAGTGIGKTFAYLTPIIESRRSALISTGARALQDQLSQRDIPALAQALGHPVSLAVLKGRANYICQQAVADPAATAGLLPAAENDDWQKIMHFAATSEEGDLRALTTVPSDSPLLAHAVSTRESCTVQKCPHYDNCFLYRARRRAQQADIVIVNHHLFLSDMRLREEGVAELLPTRDVVIFDEAHLLPQLAPQFFGAQVSTAQLQRLFKQTRQLGELLGDSGGALLPLTAAAKAALDPVLALSQQYFSADKIPAAAALAKSDWTEAVQTLTQACRQLAEKLVSCAGNPDAEKIVALAQRALQDSKTLTDWLGSAGNDAAANSADPAGAPAAAAASVPAAAAAPANNDADTDPTVGWLDYHDKSGNLIFYQTPLTGRTLFARQWAQLPTILFTSATLSISGNFTDFCEAVGLEQSSNHSWDSPYDFAARSLLYMPPDLPSPVSDQQAHTAAVVRAALPLLLANGGNAFVLFSSWRALRAAAALLQEPLAAADITILQQGDLPNDALLKLFREQSRAVLLGSQSFWQGVDVRGAALSLLIVDKIPFTPPTDPLLQAQNDWRQRRGENPFRRNQLPPAILLMKQVAGRLIRDYDDYGVFMMGDPRLGSKSYGKTILQALPPMPLCRDGAAAADFLRRLSGADAEP